MGWDGSGVAGGGVVGGGVAMLFELLPQPEKASVRKDIARISHELRTEQNSEHIHNLRRVDRRTQES